jgi:hypothetical protein
MLIFKDSDRESILSYFEAEDIMTGSNAIDKDDLFLKLNLIDTPTRLVNHSNEFLP